MQKTYSVWEIGYFDDAWLPHTNKDLWKEVDKPKELTETQIVYEVYRTNKKTGKSQILSRLLTDDMLKILEDENRPKNTYKKTGRQFEIKLEREGK